MKAYNVSWLKVFCMTYCYCSCISFLFQGNVSSPQEMASLRQKLQSLPTLAGIVLTTHVLKEEPISALSVPNFMRVMDPKLKGKQRAARACPGRRHCHVDSPSKILRNQATDRFPTWSSSIFSGFFFALFNLLF